MEISSILVILWTVSTSLIFYLLYEQKNNSEKINSVIKNNKQFLESIEKYVEIFNEHNIKELNETRDSENEIIAAGHIEEIRNEYRLKLKAHNKELSEEHEMLIDFVTLTLSLLIKTPPNLREKIINDNTDNEIIRKILHAKLSSIQHYYIPVSLLEIAISKEDF